MQEILLKTRYLKGVLSKSLKKITLFFLSSPVSFNGQDYERQMGLKLVASPSSVYQTSSEKFFY